MSESDDSSSSSSISAPKTDPQRSWKTTYDKATTKALRKKHIGLSLQTFFRRDPLKIVRAFGQYMYDERGREFLDCINNVAHVGHCHPTVVSACSDQMQILNTNCRYLHDNIVQLAQRITASLPEELSVCYFVNSGSEANDLAMRLVRYYTKNKDTLVMEHAYHGNLTSTISLSPYKTAQKNSEDETHDWVHVVPTPDRYRGRYRDNCYSVDELTDLYVNEVKAVCDQLKAAGREPAVFIHESMQSCAGQIIYPANYLRKVYKCENDTGLTTDSQVLCIFACAKDIL